MFLQQNQQPQPAATENRPSIMKQLQAERKRLREEYLRQKGVGEWPGFSDHQIFSLPTLMEFWDENSSPWLSENPPLDNSGASSGGGGGNSLFSGPGPLDIPPSAKWSTHTGESPPSNMTAAAIMRLPNPPGLNPNAPEFKVFFTIEFEFEFLLESLIFRDPPVRAIRHWRRRHRRIPVFWPGVRRRLSTDFRAPLH